MLASKRKPTIKCSIDTIAFKGPQIRQNIPLEIRKLESFSLFKLNIKQVQRLSCHWKICCSFIANLRYINRFFILLYFL